MRNTTSLLAFAVVVSSLVQSNAADIDFVHYYVSPEGSDKNEGSLSSPWKTINKAISVAKPGTTITVAPGSYDETLEISKSGTASSRIRIISSVKWGAKIWPTKNLNSHIFRVTGSYVDVDGFDMGPAGSNLIVFGLDTSGNYNKIMRNKIHDINVTGSAVGSAMGVAGTGSVIDSNYIYSAGNSQLDHGIYVYDGRSILLNNVVGNISGWGITLWHTASDVLIYNNTVFNGRTALGSNGGGILIGAGEHPTSDARNCIVANNIIYGNQGNGIIEFGIVHNNKYINNLLYNNEWEDVSLKNGTQSGTIIADPSFVSYQEDGTGKYDLRSVSRAIDRGSPSFAAGTDFNGMPRKDGAPDIGAYEFGSDSKAPPPDQETPPDVEPQPDPAPEPDPEPAPPPIAVPPLDPRPPVDVVPPQEPDVPEDGLLLDDDPELKDRVTQWLWERLPRTPSGLQLFRDWLLELVA